MACQKSVQGQKLGIGAVFSGVVAFAVRSGAIIFFAVLIGSPSTAARAAARSLEICATRLIPSLFLFIALTGIITTTRIADFIGRLFCRPFVWLFGIPPAGVCAFILGSVGGFPIGAVTAKRLYDDRLLTRDEAARLIAFSSNAGMAFCVGGIGVSLYDSAAVGWQIYLCSLVSAVIIGIAQNRGGTARRVEMKGKPTGESQARDTQSNLMTRNAQPRNIPAQNTQSIPLTRNAQPRNPPAQNTQSIPLTHNAQPRNPPAQNTQSIPPIHNAQPQSRPPQSARQILSAVSDSIAAAGLTMLNICAFAVFFGVVGELSSAALTRIAGHFGYAGDKLSAGFACLCELTLASRLCAELSPALSIPLCSFAAGFAGMSVHMQTAAVVGEIPLGRYFIAKTAQGVLAAALSALFCHIARML